MEKSPTAFRTISEVSDALEVPAHVLRFWEQKFPQIRPVKRGGGRRYYRPEDVALLIGIRELLYDDGLTIKGVQKVLRERGPRHVVRRGANGGDEATGLDFGPDEGVTDGGEADDAPDLGLEAARDEGLQGAPDDAAGDPEPDASADAAPTGDPDAAEAAREAEARAADLARIRSAIDRLEALRDRLRADPVEDGAKD